MLLFDFFFFRGKITNCSLWDRLVFSRVQKLIGGRVRLCIVASAPLAGKVLDFTRCAFGCYVSHLLVSTRHIVLASNSTFMHCRLWRAMVKQKLQLVHLLLYHLTLNQVSFQTKGDGNKEIPQLYACIAV